MRISRILWPKRTELRLNVVYVCRVFCDLLYIVIASCLFISSKV